MSCYCPKTMLYLVPGSQDDPLFCILRKGVDVPLTDSIVRKHLKRVLQILGWQHSKFSFNSFRRSGASWAFEFGVAH